MYRFTRNINHGITEIRPKTTYSFVDILTSTSDPNFVRPIPWQCSSGTAENRQFIFKGSTFIYSHSASLSSFEIDYFYGLWTRIYEYGLPWITDLPRSLHTARPWSMKEGSMHRHWSHWRMSRLSHPHEKKLFTTETFVKHFCSWAGCPIKSNIKILKWLYSTISYTVVPLIFENNQKEKRI